MEKCKICGKDSYIDICPECYEKKLHRKAIKVIAIIQIIILYGSWFLSLILQP